MASGVEAMSHAIKRLPNGGTLATLGDGTTVETTSEGVRIQTNKDGARVVTQLDGTITQSTPDGITITRRPDGSILQTNSDGACAREGRTLRVPLIPTHISARGAHAPPHLLTASPSSIPPRHARRPLSCIHPSSLPQDRASKRTRMVPACRSTLTGRQSCSPWTA